MSWPYFEELAGSGETSHTATAGNGGQRRFLVFWDSQFDFINMLAGSAHPSGAFCYVRDIQCAPLSPDLSPEEAGITDPTSQIVSYAQNGGMVALITATYATDFDNAPWPCEIAKPTIPDGTVLRLKIRGSGQLLTLPTQAAVWEDNVEGSSDGPQMSPDSHGRQIISIREFNLEWDFVDEPPVDEWDALLGKTNQSEFMGCEAETLLFESYDLEPSIQFVPTDPFCWKLTCVMRQRRIVVGENVYGWNHDHRADGWHKVLVVTAPGASPSTPETEPRYPLADMTNMFTEAPCGSGSGSASGGSTS